MKHALFACTHRSQVANRRARACLEQEHCDVLSAA